MTDVHENDADDPLVGLTVGCRVCVLRVCGCCTQSITVDIVKALRSGVPRTILNLYMTEIKVFGVYYNIKYTHIYIHI